MDRFAIDDGEFKDDTPFIDDGLIDSTGILELIMYLENEFRVKIDDDELVPENFNTLDSIATLIERKI